jgi:hypothetical protein
MSSLKLYRLITILLIIVVICIIETNAAQSNMRATRNHIQQQQKQKETIKKERSFQQLEHKETTQKKKRDIDADMPERFCGEACKLKKVDVAVGTFCADRWVLNGETVVGRQECWDTNDDGRCSVDRVICPDVCDGYESDEHHRDEHYRDEINKRSNEQQKRDYQGEEHHHERKICPYKFTRHIHDIEDRNSDCRCTPLDCQPLPCWTQNAVEICVTSSGCTFSDHPIPVLVDHVNFTQWTLCLTSDQITEFHLNLDDVNQDGLCDKKDCYCAVCGPGSGGPGSPGSNGTDGNQGPTGPQGPQGPSGDVGATGVTGIQGPSGPPGRKGERGERGEMGATGVTGPRGASGPKGEMGKEGRHGPKGPKGQCCECWQTNSEKIFDHICDTYICGDLYRPPDSHGHHKHKAGKDICVIPDFEGICTNRTHFHVYSRHFGREHQKYMCVSPTDPVILKGTLHFTDRDGNGICNEYDCAGESCWAENNVLPLACTTNNSTGKCETAPHHHYWDNTTNQFVICTSFGNPGNLNITDFNNDGICNAEDCRVPINYIIPTNTTPPCYCPSPSCDSLRVQGFLPLDLSNTSLPICNTSSAVIWLRDNETPVPQAFVCTSNGWTTGASMRTIAGGNSQPCGYGGSSGGGQINPLISENCGIKVGDVALGRQDTGGVQLAHDFLSLTNYFHFLVDNCNFHVQGNPFNTSNPFTSGNFSVVGYSNLQFQHTDFSDPSLLQTAYYLTANYTYAFQFGQNTYNSKQPSIPGEFINWLQGSPTAMCAGETIFGIENLLVSSLSKRNLEERDTEERGIDTTGAVFRWNLNCDTRNLVCTNADGTVLNTCQVP